jgi:hypothetical protein
MSVSVNLRADHRESSPCRGEGKRAAVWVVAVGMLPSVGRSRPAIGSGVVGTGNAASCRPRVASAGLPSR